MSNLLDKASIVLTPTAYSEGVVHTVKPEIEYGDELVDVNNMYLGNQTFDLSSSFSLNSSNQIVLSSQGSRGRVVQEHSFISGKKYKVSYDVVSVDNIGGNVDLRFCVSSNTELVAETIINDTDNSTGSFVTEFTANNNFNCFGFIQNNAISFEVIIDNVSVKEVTNPDFEFDRGTEATRVNSKGEVVDVNIIGSELVQNGNFEELGSELVTNGTFDTTLGSELIVNGGFDTDSDWGKTQATINNGEANIVSTDGSYAAVTQNILTVGKTYKYYLEIKELTGTLAIFMGNGVSAGGTDSFTTVGVKEGFLVANGITGLFQIARSGVCDATIDNVSIKEVQGAEHWSIDEPENITLANGKMNFESTGVFADFQQNVSLSSGFYKCKFTIENIDNNDPVKFYIGNLLGTQSYRADGQYVEYPDGDYDINLYLPNNENGIRIFFSPEGGDGSIDNISVKEVDPNGYWNTNDSTTIEDGKLVINTDNGEQNFLQLSVLEIGKKYRLTLDADIDTGVIRFESGEGNDFLIDSSSSSVVHEFIADQSALTFRRNIVPTRGTFDNISVKEITDDTDIPRINYEDFSYEEVLGEELVTNGGFDDGLSNWNFSNSGDSLNTMSLNLGGVKLTTSSGNPLFYQNANEFKGKCILSYEVLNNNGCSSFHTFNTANGYISIPFTIGTHTYVFEDFDYSNFLFRNSTAGSDITIDNISVKEVTQQVVEGSGTAHWLLEPESTNLVTYSKYFSSGSWAKTNVSVSVSSELAPDNTSFAYKLIENSSDDFHYTAFFTTLSATGTTISFYAKSGERDTVSCFLSQSGNVGGLFDLTNETATASGTGNTAEIKSVGNGWYRCSVSNDGLADLNDSIRIGVQNGALINYQGDGTSGVYIWGAQLEEKPYATSYIPTNGGVATRAAETLIGGGDASLINSEEGVLFVEMAALHTLTDYSGVGFAHPVDNSVIRILYTPNSSDTLLIQNRYLGVDRNINLTVGDVTEYAKIAVRWNSSGTDVFCNGELIQSQGSHTIPANYYSNLTFTPTSSGNYPLKGKVKQLIVYKEALTDAELECLTTKRVKEYGEELVVNGDFSDGNTGWSIVDATILNNRVELNGDGQTSLIWQDILEINKNYEVSFDVVDYNGLGNLQLINNQGGSYLDISESKKYNINFNHTDSSGNFLFRAKNGAIATIDNVSVKEIKSYL